MKAEEDRGGRKGRKWGRGGEGRDKTGEETGKGGRIAPCLLGDRRPCPQEMAKPPQSGKQVFG